MIYNFGAWEIVDLYVKNRNNFIDPTKKIVEELHAISAVLKTIASWFSAETITECREMLGGHGYSSFSGI